MLCTPEKGKQILFNIYQMRLLLLVTVVRPSETVSALRTLQRSEVNSQAKQPIEVNALNVTMQHIKHYDGLTIMRRRRRSKLELASWGGGGWQSLY